MRILAFDTAGPALSIALMDGKRTLAALHCPLERGHAELLLPAVEGVLGAGAMRLADLDGIATTVGPGSFTGLRTGLAAAQGLALGSGKPLVGVSRFEAFLEASGARGVQPVVVAMDSRARSLYVQAFDRTGAVAKGWPVAGHACPLDALAELSWLSGALIIGDGSAAVLTSVPELTDSGRRQLPAVAIAACARRALVAGHIGLPPQPLYLAPPRAVVPRDGGRLRRR